MRYLLAIILGLSLSLEPALAATFLSAYQAWTNALGPTGPSRPYVAFAGDSTMMGGNGAAIGYRSHFYNAGAPSGDTNGDIANWLIMEQGIRGTNWGYAGAQTVFTRGSLLFNIIPSNNPPYIVVLTGVNDLQTGRVWADVQSHWDDMKLECTRSNIVLVACEVWPSALTGFLQTSNFNFSLATWCTANNVPLIKSYKWMLEVTGGRTNMHPDLHFDSTHPNTNGVHRNHELVNKGKLKYLHGEVADYRPYDGTVYSATAAHDAAMPRDSLTWLPGTGTFDGTFWVTKGIRLFGTNFNIKGNFTTNYVIDWTVSEVGNTSEMAGLIFPTAATAPTFYPVVKWDGPNDRYFRFHHLTFSNVGPVSALNFFASKGSFDHSLVINSNVGAWFCYQKGNNWNGGFYGDGAWSTNLNFGTEDFLFVEDCIFTNQNVHAHVTLMDGQAGTRYVFRKNKVYKGSVECHGNESNRERSGLAFEIYENTFDGINTQDFIAYFRGGVPLIYSNYVYGYAAVPVMNLLDNRVKDHIRSPFGGADGRNPWDTNNPANPIQTATATSTAFLSFTDSSKAFGVNALDGMIIRKTGGTGVKTVTLARSGTTVTATCTGHGYTSNDVVSIWGANEYAYNFIYGYYNSDSLLADNRRLTIVDADHFKFENSWGAATPATGTIKTCKGNSFAEITGNDATQIIFADSGYGWPYTMTNEVGTVVEVNDIIHAMDMIGRSGGTNFNGVAMPSILGGGNPQVTTPAREWQNIKCAAGPAAIGAFGTPFHFSAITRKLIVGGIHYSNEALAGYQPSVYPNQFAGGIVLPPGQLGGPAQVSGGLRNVRMGP